MRKWQRTIILSSSSFVYDKVIVQFAIAKFINAILCDEKMIYLKGPWSFNMVKVSHT